uniref:Uncharacterized protein n=1 Tax=Glossina brevipalpis TaxID=37001 RepID=A0A1A9WFB3_9MUSC
MSLLLLFNAKKKQKNVSICRIVSNFLDFLLEKQKKEFSFLFQIFPIMLRNNNNKMDKSEKITVANNSESISTLQTNDNMEPRLWPSSRIPQGGLFHTPKYSYSKETADLIRLLMKESKMSMLMRKQIDSHIRNGEPLPKPKPPRVNTSMDPDKEAFEILKRARNAKRKSLAAIKASGVYDMPRYRPKPNDKMPSEKAKKLLQEAMSGLCISETTLKPIRKPKSKTTDITNDDIINELLDQIDERAEWLAEMEELGEGKKYRDEIREQIADILRQIKLLETKTKLQAEGIRYVE